MDSRDDFASIVSVLYLLFKTKISFLVKLDSKVYQRFVTISLQLSAAYRMWFFSEHFSEPFDRKDQYFHRHEMFLLK